MKVRLIEEQVGYSGFFRLRRVTLEHERYDGSMSAPRAHEVLERSDVAAAVLFDPASDSIVMVEQFRPGAFAAGLHPWLLDIVAGRIEPGQSPQETIMREIAEEAGLTPHAVEFVGSYLTAPHLSSERVHLFCAHVDASRIAGTRGLPEEGEDIRPVVMERAAALGLLQSGVLPLWAGLALAWISGRRRE